MEIFAVSERLAETVKEHPGENVFFLRKILGVSVLSWAVNQLLKEKFIFRKKFPGERYYRFYPGKKIIIDFILATMIERDRYNFTLKFLCAKEGLSEDEASGNEFAEKFCKFLKRLDRSYNFVKYSSLQKAPYDVVFYLGWGGDVYAHIAILDREVLKIFAGHLVRFAQKHGTLEISDRSIKLRKFS
ncbi:hypothetical protein COV49_01770 [Candidatus Falkowbacteria bacterium CG11_big_fil_rev_8_21_14_0_20_39_10]|uniref:Uncharacterized protein n=1 Tax=Candidatus Falkowbacteria bacterium CG11_big_fil_rev_8_21_14_0_20_39_10 TaxID=1974570 RepID=A0A2M6K9K6_9BACT|nr:MAG: hypothetical protein COV49_01770 [Candidatus Falkowbacteria bacterium CG11_big_fil_rev_8_21_14_0_20_39_10]